MSGEWATVWLTIRLAATTTAVLLILGTPLAWWLARTRSSARHVVAPLVALPIVLPPTVLGFYLLLALGPEGPVGGVTTRLGLGTLPFTFAGLVVASVIYSLPFVVQPIRTAFESIEPLTLEVAATLGARPLDRFASVALPLARTGIVTGAILGFAHTVGEFGVVLMIGGNIPGRTRVMSVAVYDHVESLQWARAHWLAGGMVAFAFAVVLAMSLLDRRRDLARG